MKNYCDKKNGYRYSIEKGLMGARTFNRGDIYWKILK